MSFSFCLPWSIRFGVIARSTDIIVFYAYEVSSAFALRFIPDLSLHLFLSLCSG